VSPWKTAAVLSGDALAIAAAERESDAAEEAAARAELAVKA
jgi:hypothetical protein